MKHFIEKNSFFPYLFISIVVFSFYCASLTFSWKSFDEDIIYTESILPIPYNMEDFIEIIKNFGIHNHYEASNLLYSNIYNIRGSSIDLIFLLTLLFLFKKNCFLYHLFSVFLHVLNSLLCFKIISKVSANISGKPFHSSILISVFLTLIWALYPVNVESIVFATNGAALLTYFISLFLINDSIKKIDVKNETIIPPSKLNMFKTFIFYLFSLLLCEYSIVTFIFIFSYVLLFGLHKFKNGIKNQYKNIFIFSVPFLLSIIICLIHYYSLPGFKNNIINDISLTLERVFWFSPQIFIHNVKLLFFPVNLSIDQSGFVILSKKYISFYSLFCISVFLILIFFSILSIIKIKKNVSFIFAVTFIPAFIFLLPFLHIISPVYNLSSERYLYMPTFALIFGLSHFISQKYSAKASDIKLLITGLSIILLLFSFRSFSRMLDWKDDKTFLLSTINNSSNSLYKGLRLYTLWTSNIWGSKDDNFKNNLLNSAINNFTQGLINYENEERLYQQFTPRIIKYYGLDAKTLKTKAAYLIAESQLKVTNDYKRAFEIFKPYDNNIQIYNSSFLDFYYKISFHNNNLDSFEIFLHELLKINKISPTLFAILSDLSEYKYKDLEKSKQFLTESKKLFPYDVNTLYGLKRIYGILGDLKNESLASYLYGLRTHNIKSFQQSAIIYLMLNDKTMAKKIIDRLYRDYDADILTTKINNKYIEIYGQN